MKLIQQSAEIWGQQSGLEGVYKQVEKAARLCYKSEDKITDDSYKKFIDMLEKREHLSPLEHGTIYLKFTWPGATCEHCNTTLPFRLMDKYCVNPFSKVVNIGNDVYVTTNLRVIKEQKWEDDLKYLCEPTEHHEKRVSVHITTSRGITHELIRHRVFSFCQESQRYVNYSKDKFSNEVTFIIPSWVNTHCPNQENEGPSVADMEWNTSMLNAEASYLNLLKMGWKPQEAREVLPNSTKTELIITGFESDWEHFFRLRCSPAAHPEMQELANQIKEQINEI